jgi:hypothetical protein
MNGIVIRLAFVEALYDRDVERKRKHQKTERVDGKAEALSWKK